MASGFEEDFLDPVDEDFNCSICHLPLREPVQTKCGHRFCKLCLEKHMERQEMQLKSCTCPLDRENLVRNEDIFPDKAMERKILSLAVKCPSDGCEWNGELRYKEEHLGMCKKLPVECPDGCGTIVMREKISDHSSKDCPLTETFCPYSEMGCNKKIQRKLLETHLESAVRLHLDLACVKLHRTQEEFKETTRKLEEKVDALEKKLEERVNEKVNSFQKKIDGVQESLTTRIEINDYLYDLRFKREGTRVSDGKRESPSFIWKIKGMYTILREARRSTKVESEPFYSGANGYKLKVLMKPRGDLSRSGKNGYVSFYLVIMRGKYDAILPWPFRRTVTFRLIDQQENPDYREDAVDMLVFRDIDSDTSLRPTAEENDEGYGFSKFICHDEILRRGYIVNDTAILVVQVSGPS